MYRIRARYEKRGRVKYLGHLEMIKVFERAFRRVGVPLKYTEGFNPHPKMSFALPSSVGFSSIGEYIDVEVTEAVKMDKFIDAMNSALPDGLKVIAGGYVDIKAKSLMSLVDYSEFEIDFPMDAETDKDSILEFEKILETGPIPARKRTKSGKFVEKDLKDDIHGYEVIRFESNQIILKVLLSAGSRGNLNPLFLLKGLGEKFGWNIDSCNANILRKDLFSKTDSGPISLEKTVSEVEIQ
ncbi:MAG TPA: TIGR03936 family radical SAM-associated protein [Clostridia bacterium]|nr:TIGR03936 family radical SAM-associated protein [Clostridia bacterium]